MAPFIFNVTLQDGRAVQLFVNPETNLVVVDVCEKSGRFGNEVVRQTLPPPMTATEKRQLRAAFRRQDQAAAQA